MTDGQYPNNEAYLNEYGAAKADAHSSNLKREVSNTDPNNLTVSLPMTTSTSQPSSTKPFDDLRSMSREQREIDSRASGFDNNLGDTAKIQNSPKNADISIPNAGGSDVPPASPNGGAAAAAVDSSSGKSANKAKATTFVIAFVGALVACVLFFAIGSALGLFSTKTVLGTSNNVTLGSTSNSDVNASDDSSTLAEAVSEKCLPSVVSISVYGIQSSSTSIFDYLGGGSNNSSTETQISTGSGVVISKDGYIITNQHVIESGTRFEANVNGKTIEAKLVGQDASSDIAVLNVEAGEDLTSIELGDSDTIKTGEWVMSIGSPFGLEQSVATGIISATSRSQVAGSSDSSSSSSGTVRIYPNMIQTDAAINPGNSGGALVNENGQLIGINALITSSSGNYSGVGFAIPSNYAIGIAKDLIEGKSPTYAFLGVSCSTVTESIAQRYGFKATQGAYVAAVTENSGAANGGIEVGDIITEFDGEKVTSSSDLTLDARKKNPGDTVSIKLYRGDTEKTVEVTLGQKSDDSSSSTNQNNSQNSQGQGGSGQQGQQGGGQDLLY